MHFKQFRFFKYDLHEGAKLSEKNVSPRHYPKGSALSKIGAYFLEELFRVFFISNEWCLQCRELLFQQSPLYVLNGQNSQCYFTM